MARLRPSQKNTNIAEILLCVVSVFSLSILLYSSFFVYPSGDDYGYAFRIQRDGFIYSFIDTYMNWSGRYMATLLSFFNPLFFSFSNLYSLYSLILIILFVASTYFFIHHSIYTASLSSKVLAMALLLCTIWAGMPTFFESYFWFSSYISYTIPCIFTLAFLGTLFYYERNELKLSLGRSVLLTIFLSFCLVVIIGCNELALIMIDCALFLMLYSRWKNRSMRFLLLVLCFVALISSIVVFVAPGNYARMEISQARVDIFQILSYATIFTCSFLLKNIPLLSAMSLVYLLVVAPHIGEKKSIPMITPLNLSVFAGIVIWFIHIFTFLTTDTCPLARTENIVFIFLVFSWTLVLYTLVPNSIITIVRTRRSTISIALVMILFLFFMFRYESSVNTVVADIVSGSMSQFAKDRQMQIDMQKSSEAPFTEIPSITVAPKTVTYVLYDDRMHLNSVISPGEPIYGTVPVFPNDTIKVRETRDIWNQIKTDIKDWEIRIR